MEYVNLQFSAFLLLLFSGMILGSFFDFYRVFRSQIKVNKIVDLVGDLIFWFLTGILIIPLIYWSTWLELRFYVWVSIFLGLVLYFGLFSQICIPIFKKFWHFAGWLPRILFNWLWRLGMIFRRIIRIFLRKKT